MEQKHDFIITQPIDNNKHHKLLHHQPMVYKQTQKIITNDRPLEKNSILQRNRS